MLSPRTQPGKQASRSLFQYPLAVGSSSIQEGSSNYEMILHPRLLLLLVAVQNIRTAVPLARIWKEDYCVVPKKNNQKKGLSSPLEMTSQNDIYKGPCAAEKIEQEGGPPVQEVFPVNLKSLCQIRIFIKKILVFGGIDPSGFRTSLRAFSQGLFD